MKDENEHSKYETHATHAGHMPLGKTAILLLVFVAFLTLFNQLQISKVSNAVDSLTLVTANAAAGSGGSSSSGSSGSTSLSGVDIIPKGVPVLYGEELGVSFDDVSANNAQKADSAIKTLGALDNQITLTGNDLTRYIAIATQISCEYCCGADAIIFDNGKPACGCAHSYAMRGVAKYLITKHGSEFTDNEILEEMGKWKTLFFPGIMTTKAGVLKSKGIELNYINIASNKYRGIEQGASSSGGSMVGGC